MKRRSIPPLALAALISLTGTSGAQAPATAPATKSDADIDRARTLYKKAQLAFEAEHFDEARQLLLQVWEIRRTTDTASELGHTEMELRMYRDAAEHFEYCLGNFPPTGSKKLLKAIQEASNEAKLHIGQIRVVTNRDGAEVLVDGRLVGTSPLVSVVFVEPGSHELDLRAGTDAASSNFEVVAGGTYEANVPIETTPSAAASATPATAHDSGPVSMPPAPNLDRHDERSLVPVVVGGVVFAAGVATALGFHFAANSEHDKLQTYRDQYGPSGCINGTASASECATQWNTAKAEERDRKLSTAGLVLAGTALIGTSLYWFWPRGTSTTAGRRHEPIQVTGNIQSKGLGLWVTGGF